MKNNNFSSLNHTRLENLTSNLKEAWSSVTSAILNFSLLLYEAYESKIFREKYKTWRDYIETKLPIKRRQADYYRKVGEFYCNYEKLINLESIETFTLIDFKKLLIILNKINKESKKKELIKRIFTSETPQIEMQKYLKK